ncbi:hypothetical protein [Roseococcus sp. YIM B11640]|uniref:hypothetical protein n=1 Tax=Roseococcus sp. YIM B11640 TaxID=3133973 RepID=UPI003C7BCE1C
MTFLHRPAIAAAAVTLMAGVASAQAQSNNTCAGRINVTSVSASGSAPYDYAVQVQNITAQARMVTITTAGWDQHPDTATLPYIAPVRVAAYTLVNVPLGSGTKRDINTSTVTIIVDRPATRDRRSLAINNCAPAP